MVRPHEEAREVRHDEPTHPTMPATATDADVSSVANPMTASRVRFTSTPSERASSSPRP